MEERRLLKGNSQTPLKASDTQSTENELPLPKNLGGSSVHGRQSATTDAATHAPSIASVNSKAASAEPSQCSPSGDAPSELKSILVNRQLKPRDADEDADTGKGPCFGPTQSQFFGTGHSQYSCWERFTDFMMPLWENEVNFVLKEECDKQAFADRDPRPIRSKPKFLSQTIKAQETEATTVKSVTSVVSASSCATRAGQMKRRPLRTSLNFWGLTFLDKKIEEEFEFNNTRVFKYRNAFTGVVCFAIVALDYLLFLLAANSTVYLSGAPAALIGFHLIFSLSFVCIFCFVFIYKLPFFRTRQEQTSYMIVSMAYITVFIIVLATKIQLYWGDAWERLGKDFLTASLVFYKDPDYSPKKDVNDPRFAAFVVLNEILLSSVVDGYYYVVTLLFTAILPSRNRFIAVHQTIIVLLNCIVTLVGVGRYTALIFPALYRITTMVNAYILGLSGEFLAEVQRRGLFYEWYMMRKKLNQIHQERKKAQKKHATSGLDDLRTSFNEIRSVLIQAKMRCKEYDVTSEVSQALELVEEAMKLLTNSWNLYTVQMDDTLKKEEFIKAMDVEPRVKRICLVSGPQGSIRTAVRSMVEKAEHGSSSFDDRVAAPKVSLELPKVTSLLATKYAVDLLPVVGIDISYNILEFSKKCPDTVLQEVGYVLLNRIVCDWGCEDKVLCEFLYMVKTLYRENSYHNQIHGAMVAHYMVCLLRGLGINREMNSLSTAACAVAALCHDIGHPGRNNNFFVASGAPLAVLYNDKAVLENFHSALTFRVLGRHDCNVFAYLSDEEFKHVRANMIDLILATDMKTHFDFLSRFRNRRQAPGFNFHKVAEDQWLAAEICIRASDLGHAMTEWDQHFEWASRVVTEFYLQGEEERRLGLHVSPLCDRDDHPSFSKCQHGFLGYVVKPLIAELGECDTLQRIIPQLMQNLKENMERWEAFTNEGVNVVLSSAALAYDIKGQGVDVDVDVNVLTAKDILAQSSDSVSDLKHQRRSTSERRDSAMQSNSTVGAPAPGSEAVFANRSSKLQETLIQQQRDFEIQQQNLMKQIVELKEQNAFVKAELERQRAQVTRQYSGMDRQDKGLSLLEGHDNEKHHHASSQSSALKKASQNSGTTLECFTSNSLFDGLNRS
ncbi:3'5'-cyclic nucleotide phosphodiesterase domain-containing protein [Toxoplasma gondii GAB2-2007-GAL-DOM2]|uniref:Phosphodiesterase n=10 Tax=Toxoplasma gondii TaxID=5811 RepID=V4ZBC8_TOXGV|nr:3'5'-cyclic nucleotide phosphodiesterase domain-containing protein [Toxoplasma gondii VEG]KFG31039.1 3'5'-cyclic nucleotide phosphodiesterase domain-containing protein [Toxoplasma gondii GAB2-2007-GAL-DOM2]KFG43555.1 3'5'-cyclic nucleotide phosphodiesterase domain-containing protein [Toxoplasma gondii p89]KFH04061.1 3'5'-cyclic nucleotide phosphodiesterase domain-containing protein [Toxoplasma gondii VAND]CEL72527.1 TPA: 3',5'--cyclic-nucleotide phosphodiesterase,putative [Toxoplasma gondii 